MKANRGRDTAAERRLRSALHRRGLRFRVDHRPDVPGLRSRPDIVFPRQRLVVYVDGCFWHRCPLHGTAPKANEAFWAAKLDANVERDGRTTAALERAGWRVVRIWEHVPVDEAAGRVVAALVLSSPRLSNARQDVNRTGLRGGP
jgi:DNA mismatch endonuclease (patch repair protein)